MINSQTLKTFVKMHEHKLNVKVKALEARKLHGRLEETGKDFFEPTNVQSPITVDRRRMGHHFETPENRHRPKSHYFNLIVTG